MAQFARPASDISRASWTTQSNGTANLWATIDDESANDADFIRSSLTVNDAYECSLTSVAPAVIPRAHSLIIRGHKDAANGNQRGVDVALLQGTTVIGSTSFSNLPATATQQIVDIPRSWAANITDYSALRLRITATGSVAAPAGNRRRAIVTGATIRVPAAADLVDDLLTRWGIAEDTSTPGVVRLSHSGFTGEGPNRSRAVWELYQAMKQDEAFYVANAAVIERRFAIAYGLWKVVEYSRIRDEIVAGTYPLPAHQNQAQGIAICDTKIARFIASAKEADTAETM